MDPIRELDDIVLKLASLNNGKTDIHKLMLKAKAIGAVTSWLKAERESEVRYARRRTELAAQHVIR